MIIQQQRDGAPNKQTQWHYPYYIFEVIKHITVSRALYTSECALLCRVSLFVCLILISDSFSLNHTEFSLDMYIGRKHPREPSHNYITTKSIKVNFHALTSPQPH
eukprot:TRINITY_DN3660_c0_g2_i2.p1 TRINITY_DN3660_c0_g2~~TRINITY_DN3660_c0_g2_i2.p1  ORF type:complete len:105 (-),score=16.64 TRINITY_DN3660_c0_g2_i2:395-709(-)